MPAGGDSIRWIASLSPFGSCVAGAGAVDERSGQLASSALPPRRAANAPSSSRPSQLHLPWTELTLRSSRQWEHCDVGRPFSAQPGPVSASLRPGLRRAEQRARTPDLDEWPRRVGAL